MSIYCSLVFIKFRLKLNLIVLDLSLVWAELLPSYNSVSNYSLHLCVCVCVWPKKGGSLSGDLLRSNWAQLLVGWDPTGQDKPMIEIEESRLPEEIKDRQLLGRPGPTLRSLG